MHVSRLLSATILAATVAVTSFDTPALAHSSVRGATLRASEVPSYFNVDVTHYYTSYSDFLSATFKKLGRKTTLTCPSPNILSVGKFQAAMIQMFENSGAGLQDFKVCSWLYASSAKAHKAYSYEARTAGNLFLPFQSHKVPSHIAAESVVYVGNELDGVVFRTDNVVVLYYYGDFGGLRMSTSSLLGLANKLIGRMS